MECSDIDTLYVFPTGRAIRERYANADDALLARSITILEFFERACIVEGKSKIDDTHRKIYLHKAIKSVNVEKLGFAKSFLEFLEHSEFIFLFLDEIDGEFVGLDKISRADVYAEFDEHIKILSEIRSIYLKLLSGDGFYDLSARCDFSVNRPYFKNFKKIHFKSSGYLTNFELLLLQKVAALVPLWLEIELNRYNKKMVTKLQNMDFLIDGDGEYLFDFAQKKILLQKEPKPMPKIIAHHFESRISQCAFVFKKIFDFVQLGIEPQNIAVVTPDEAFGEYLRTLDIHKNLNLAKGMRLKSIEMLRMVLEFVKKRQKNRAHCQKQGCIDIALSLQAKKDELGYECFELFFREFLDAKSALLSQKELEIIEEGLFLLQRKSALLKEFTLLEILHLFYSELSSARLDDVGGGKVTVMGVLEGRDVSFEGVIFVDFNDGVVPKPSEKELFLNSKIKEAASLPTPKEREALQKYHYLKIIKNAKNIAIACVKNDESEPSSFLYELEATLIDGEGERLNGAVFGAPTKRALWDEKIILDVDLADTCFSSSKLTTFLECRRKYFFRYIKKIDEPKEPNRSATFGTLLHEALREVYEGGAPKSAEELKKSIWSKLEPKCKDDASLRFEAALFLESANSFFENEAKRLECGCEPMFFERKFEVEIFGVKFGGKIDRIDRCKDGYLVIDYKYKQNLKIDTQKSLDRSVDFQMPIYFLAAKSFLDGDCEAWYYDIKEGLLLREETLSKKLDLLASKLELIKQKSIDFEKTDEHKRCHFCAYKLICGR